MEILIDEMSERDWPQVRAIYQAGIDTNQATFETTVPEWQQWHENHLRHCRIVAKIVQSHTDKSHNGELPIAELPVGDRIAGWAALSAVSRRQAYAGVAEISIYLGEGYRGQGIGRRLLTALIAGSEARGIWTLQAGIFAENQVSIRLHESCGFRAVGRRERIAKLHDRWRDILLMERRSSLVGVG